METEKRIASSQGRSGPASFKAAPARSRSDRASTRPTAQAEALALAETQAAEESGPSADSGPEGKQGTYADAEMESGMEARTPKRKGAAPPALARGRDNDLMALEAEEDRSYSAPASPAPSLPRERASAAAAPPATTPKPWAPLGYTLTARVGEASLRGGLNKVGVRVLRHDPVSGRFELAVPAPRISDLEVYLRGLGALTPSPQPVPGPKDGTPIRLTLQVAAP